MRNIKNILVATDLSPAADDVVRGAAALAELAGAALHVLHTYEFEATPYTKGLPASTFQERIDQVRNALDDQIARVVPGRKAVASREVMIYTAHKAILQRAEIVEADLIVVGRHREGRGGPQFLGGTADAVVRDATVPILILSGPLRVPLARVLVPIDLSEPALRALDVAINWSTSLGPAGEPPAITVLHVIPRVYDGDMPFDTATIAAQMHAEIGAVETRAEMPSFVRVQEEVRWGDDPAEEILRYLREQRIDLTVLGTHGYGFLKRALIGSVASAVARKADCPILLVPPALL